jgi:hypothetical protein
MQCGLPYSFFASATQKDRPIDHESASDFQNEHGGARIRGPDLSMLLGSVNLELLIFFVWNASLVATTWTV